MRALGITIGCIYGILGAVSGNAFLFGLGFVLLALSLGFS